MARISKTATAHNMCFDFIYNFCMGHFSFYKEIGISSKMYIGLHVKYLSLLSNFKETRISSKDCPKNTQIQNFIKICPVETELFHVDEQADRQTDMTKLAAFRNFAHEAKNV
jgi:hypothetical protein